MNEVKIHPAIRWKPNHSFQPTRYSALRALTLAAELVR
jgi:hypothetical protein